ncbi:HNH endonuclease domain-containing protein [Flavobacterium piscis]|uniref:HNH domain-containing protein n=1 Tax=Flavobacterium piscis TaxID=1114874 RepID=A0ABU1Y8E3_9FLAO|nr:HNH endonuclease domain-containing protein [Flavobacterium piscis]MDR7210507.1 hypothetical protein [Flavobacterium piscis]
MVQINEKILIANIVKFDKEITILNKKLYSKLINFRKNHSHKLDIQQTNYLNKLIRILKNENFIKLNKKSIKNYKTAIGKVPTGIFFYKKKNEDFKEVIKTIFNYSDLRNEFLPSFFYSLNIKACVYCNANYTTAIEKEKNVFEARFQFDHVLPSSEYPHFSVSLINLVPACFKCNHNKSDRPIKFDFYCETLPKNEYTFNLDKSSVINFFNSFNNNDLKIIFNDPYRITHKKTSIDNNFHINKIYNEHKDIAEEIIIKSYIYNNSYLDDLKKFYAEKLPHSKVPFERLISGNYMTENDILLRPMAKFTQDLYKEIKLLKNDINKIID